MDDMNTESESFIWLAAMMVGGAVAAVRARKRERTSYQCLHKAAAMRIYDFRVGAGARAEVHHTHHTLRWRVAPSAECETPAPAFFGPGSAHIIYNAADAEHREIVFELPAAQAQHTAAEVARLERGAFCKPMIGTKVNFENELCRAVELRLPPGGGDPDDFHHHVLDYGLCFVGEDLRITVFRLSNPNPNETKAEKVHVKTAPVADGFATFKPVAKGDLTVYALHNLINANPRRWLRCYQVELK
eukprot:g4741.t1